MNRLILTILMVIMIMVSACGGEEPAAEVNGEIITLEELEREVKSLEEASLPSENSFDETERQNYRQLLREEALDMLIRDLVLMQELEKRNIELDYERAQEYMQMVKEIYGEEMFQQILESGGTTEEQFLNDFALNAAIEELYVEATADVSVESEEVSQFYELNPESFHEGRASHILVNLDWQQATEEEQKAAEKQAENVIERLEAGEDFADVAREVSDDSSAEQGGALDERFSMIDSPYVDAFTVGALQLEEGEFTREPVVSEFGLHIIKLDEKVTDFDKLSENVRKYLLTEQRDDYFREYIEQLRQDSEIRIFIETGGNDN